MIKKILAFVLLLGAGYFVLWAAVGGESFAHIAGSTPTLGTDPAPAGSSRGCFGTRWPAAASTASTASWSSRPSLASRRSSASTAGASSASRYDRASRAVTLRH